MKEIKCPNCGKKVNSNSSICRHCGYIINKDNVIDSDINNDNNNTRITIFKRSDNNHGMLARSIVSLVIAILLIIGSIVLMIVGLINNIQDKNTVGIILTVVFFLLMHIISALILISAPICIARIIFNKCNKHDLVELDKSNNKVYLCTVYNRKISIDKSDIEKFKVGLSTDMLLTVYLKKGIYRNSKLLLGYTEQSIKDINW